MSISNRGFKWGLSLGLVGFFVVAGSALVRAQDVWRSSQRTEAANKDLNSVYFLDSKRGWIGGDEGLVLYTADAGQTWQTQTLNVTSAVNDIYFRDKENGFLLSGSHIFQTRDSGQTWRQGQTFDVKRFGGVPEFYSVRFTGKNKGWVVGSVSNKDAVIDSLVLKTEDGGASWRRVVVPSREELIHLDFANEDRGWLVGASGTILFTVDAGDAWGVQRTGTSDTLYHVDFRNQDRGWVVGEKGTILRTVDGGGSWLRALIPFKNTLLSVQFVDDKRGWVVGRGGIILRSEDGGVTWVRQANPAKQNLYALFVENKNGWAVGGEGIVLKYAR